MRCKTIVCTVAAFLTAFIGIATGRTAVVVCDRVLLRDSPDKDYVVELVLYRGCRVETDARPANNKYAHAHLFYTDDLGQTHNYYGWVEKRYLTYDTLKIASRKNGPAFVVAPLIPYGGGKEHNPNKDNRRNYPAGRYRGGDPQPAPWVKRYQTGNRGGCFYVNANGKKVYVDKKFCNPKSEGVRQKRVKNAGDYD